MKNCRVNITSVVDGRKVDSVRMGKIEILPNLVKLWYEEEQAIVELCLEDKKVTINRTGDYTLRLAFEKGQICDGTLGISGSKGDLQTETTRLAYSVADTSFMLSLHYQLLIGGEAQTTRLRLFAKIN
ncbi:MAG: DUF1934 domain-containing protein [Clostridiales bacterium]|nr:DUF1934 domain-containing protein [Clostridiales bacterium]